MAASTVLACCARASVPVLLLLALAATLTLGVPIVLGNPDLRPPSQALLFLAYLFVLHAALVTAVAGMAVVGLGLVAGRSGEEPTPSVARGVTLAVVLAAFAALNLSLRFTLTYSLFRGGSLAYIRPLGIANLLVFAAALPVAFFGAWWYATGRARRAAACLLGYLVVLGALIGVNRLDEVPARAALDGVVPAAAATTEGVGPEAGAGERVPRNVALLGVDGLTWLVLAPMIERGELPAFAALARDGARAHLDTIIPTFSPTVWTTIATGRSAAHHGVHAFAGFGLPGLDGRVESGPIVSSINWWNGLNRLLAAASMLGLATTEAVSSARWRVPAMWEVAARSGVRVGVYNWLMTWPVLRMPPGSYMVRGFQDLPGHREPPEAVGRALSGLAPLPKPPAGSVFTVDPYFASMWQSHQRGARESIALHARFRPRLAVAYMNSPDRTQHLYWRGSGGGRFLHPRELDRAPSRELAEVYAMVDDWLGDFRAGLGDDTLLLVVSDHGYSFDGHEHHQAPPGVLLAAGPGVVPGRLLDRATIYDVAPTVLAALGVPLARELEGRVLEELFLPGALPEPRFVKSYAPPASAPGSVERDTELERRRLDELRALGYVN